MFPDAVADELRNPAGNVHDKSRAGGDGTGDSNAPEDPKEPAGQNTRRWMQKHVVYAVDHSQACDGTVAIAAGKHVRQQTHCREQNERDTA